MPSIELIILTGISFWLTYIFFIKSLRRYPQGILLLFFIYVVFSVNSSVFYLDFNNVYISEASTTSTRTNASFRLLFFNFLIFFGVWIGFYFSKITFIKADTSVLPPSLRQCYLALSAVAFVLFISIANIIVTGNVPYPGSGFSRHGFWEGGTRFQFIPEIFGILIFFVPFVCASVWLYGNNLKNKSITLIAKTVLLFYYLYLLIGGQVFHGFLLPSTVVFGILIIKRLQNGKSLFNFRRVIVFSIVTYLLINVVFSSFQNRGITQSFDSVADAVVYRVLALQGSTYWASDAIWTVNGSIGNFSNLLEGREFLILSIMPSKLAESYLESGINLQGALPATTILSVGFFYSTIICFLYGLVLGGVISLVFYAIFRGKIFLLFPLSYIWLWVIGVYSRGSLEEIFSMKFFVFSFFVVIYFIAYKSKKISRIYN